MARRLFVLLVCALVLVPSATAATRTTAPAATAPTAPTATTTPAASTTPTLPAAQPTPTLPRAQRLSQAKALAIFEHYPKVAAWLDRYPTRGITNEVKYDVGSATWSVKLWWGAAGEIAQGKVDDATGAVVEAWTGPQVAWGMARGSPGAFGGKYINSPWLWGAFCIAFLIGLGDLRRPLSLRNLDLLFLLSPTASLWFFNHGDIFTAAPLIYPVLVWVVARGIWVGVKGRGSRARPVWPVWMLVALTVFLAGFRVTLNIESSNVIDVGYSGVVGADLIVHGEAPWGNFPVEDGRPACGPADANGEIRDRIQTNGRCESANPQGDTYGPVAYESYIPGRLIRGWSGKWDTLPAAHFTSIAFDLLCMFGLWLVGRRFGGLRLGATLAFAWAAYPFTQYVSSSNTNDALMPCFLIYGFWLASSPVARGVAGALSGWTKFASLVVAPLWLTYPDRRPSGRFVAGFVAATLVAFSVVLLEPSPLHELRAFWDRSIWWQAGRSSPFSLWDWRQYHARGLPDLHIVQRVLEVALVAGALAAAVVPRHKSPLQLAALTAALLAGFELVLTYWLYTYIPWFFPFAAIAVLAPVAVVRVAPVHVEDPPVEQPQLAPAH